MGQWSCYSYIFCLDFYFECVSLYSTLLTVFLFIYNEKRSRIWRTNKRQSMHEGNKQTAITVVYKEWREPSAERNILCCYARSMKTIFLVLPQCSSYHTISRSIYSKTNKQTKHWTLSCTHSKNSLLLEATHEVRMKLPMKMQNICSEIASSHMDVRISLIDYYISWYIWHYFCGLVSDNMFHISPYRHQNIYTDSFRRFIHPLLTS